MFFTLCKRNISQSAMLFVIFYRSFLAFLPIFSKISGQNVDFVNRGILRTQAMLGGLGNGEVIVMI